MTGADEHPRGPDDQRGADGQVESGGQDGEPGGSRPSLDLSGLRRINPRDYAIRFAFGGAISVIAALLGSWATERFGGIFTAFPAILLASLTLIGEHTGPEASAEDAEGAAAGALALAATAAFIAATVARITGAASLLVALGAWLALSLALYALFVKIGWLRTPRRS